jgi:hypothetical protein
MKQSMDKDRVMADSSRVAPLLVAIVATPLAVTPSSLATLDHCAIHPPLALIGATAAATSVAKDVLGGGAAVER